MRYLVLGLGVDIYEHNDQCALAAAENGHMGVLRFLVEQGVNIRGGNAHCIRAAARNGHIGADIHAGEDACIRQASARGHTAVVRYAAELGADIHLRDDFCMREAVLTGKTPTGRYLISIGVDVRDGLTRYEHGNNQFEVVQYLAAIGPMTGLLHYILTFISAARPA